MTDVRTSGLQLHAIDVAEGDRIVALKRARPTDAWTHDFPFEGDVVAASVFLRSLRRAR